MTVDQDVFNRHIYQDEVTNVTADTLIKGDIIIIQKRAYSIAHIVPLPNNNLIFAFRQGVMLQCNGNSLQQKYK